MAFEKPTIDRIVKENLPFHDPWHNDFHLEMPFGLINDPNGLSFFQGKYHIFYQWNPLGITHKNKCWGHVETKDFVHYTRPTLALWPSDEHDKDGCYSGCAYEEDGKLRVLYTCNRKEDGVRIPAQRIGTWLEAEKRVEKNEILVPHEPEGYGTDFRDPCRFVREGKEYLVLGGQEKATRKGRALLYTKYYGKWRFLGELKTGLNHFGYMWECPNMLQIGNKDVFLFSPQGLPSETYAYQNLYQSGYFLGTLDMKNLTYMHGAFHELDYGFDFYAPQAFTHEGRTLLLGWMGMPERETEYPTQARGWLFSLTMPRELTIKDDRLLQNPVEELEALRTGSGRNLRSEGQPHDFVELYEKNEIDITAELKAARSLTLQLNFGVENVKLEYIPKAKRLTINRKGMALGGRGIRYVPYDAGEVLRLRIFMDRTAVEVFCGEGEAVASFFVFPRENTKRKLVIHAEGELGVVRGTIWEMGGLQWNAE